MTKLKLLLPLLLLLLLPSSSRAQAVIVGQPCGGPGVSAISTNGTPVQCQGSPLVWTAIGGGSGSTSVSVLPATCTPGTTQPVMGSATITLNEQTYPAGTQFWCSATNTWSAINTASSPNNATIYAADPKYNLPQPAKWVCDATYTNNSPTVTTPATDRPFLATDSFAVVWGGNAQCGGNPDTTITTLTPATVGTYTTATFVSAHTITLAGNALASCTPTAGQGGCALVWGPDHTAAIQSAFNDAANNCGTLILPGSGLIFTSVVTNTTALCPTTNAGNDVDSSMTVQGQGWNATMLMFVPGFNFSSSMFSVTNTNGIRLRFHDFQLASFTSATAGQSGQTGLSVFFNGEVDNLSLFDFFPSNANAFTALNCQGVVNAGTSCHHLLILNAGLTAIATNATDVNIYDNWVQGSTDLFSIAGCGAGATLVTRDNRFTLSGTQGAANVSSATCIWHSYGDRFSSSGTTSCAVNINGAAGTVVDFNDVSIGGTQTTGPTLCVRANNTVTIDGAQNTVSASGGTASGLFNAGTTTLRNTTVSSSGGAGFANQATGVLNVKEGNTFSNTITNASGGVFQGQPGQGVLVGSCTGTATASQTLTLFGLGENSATTCTVTGAGTLGERMSKPGTAYALYVTAGTGGVAAGSGVFTVFLNHNGTNSAQTITCTVGTGTNCFDGAHTFAYVAGDIITVQFTTQAAETLANLRATVVTQ